MDDRPPVQLPPGVLAVRAGPGANCSSIGSVVDLLFGTAVLASVVYAAVAASLADSTVDETSGDPEAEAPGKAPEAPEKGP
ncbi:MAG: hypothetical protein HYV09_15510 [Deltaproteobacteria bacterium]|nr:hypothetical protein [Deltaproteobacteria bacterium]